jgi:hypothetical protein
MGHSWSNWEPVLTDLFSEFPVVADAAARFSQISEVPVVSAAACLGAVQLRMTAQVK